MSLPKVTLVNSLMEFDPEVARHQFWMERQQNDLKVFINQMENKAKLTTSMMKKQRYIHRMQNAQARLLALKLAHS